MYETIFSLKERTEKSRNEAKKWKCSSKTRHTKNHFYFPFTYVSCVSFERAMNETHQIDIWTIGVFCTYSKCPRLSISKQYYKQKKVQW